MISSAFCAVSLALLPIAVHAGVEVGAAGIIPGVAPVQETEGRGQEETDSVDPETSSRGRETYLGRPVARTMHWTGAEWLMRESRENEEQCSKLLTNLGDIAGKTICDFGCGNGFYTLPISELVGETGRVLAVDLQQEMLSLLEGRTRASGLQNIIPVKATLTDTGLEPESCDGILLVDVYHEISHPVTVLKGLRDALKPDGKLHLVEYRLEDESVPIKLKHKMSKAQIILEMSTNGLRFAAEFNELPWQHVMSFEKDPSFDPAKPLGMAPGKAVAEGLRRAVHARDALALEGYFADKVTLVTPSTEADSPGERRRTLVERDSVTHGLVAYMDAHSAQMWRRVVNGWQLEVRGQTGEGTILLASTAGTHPIRWVLSKNTSGQWLVAEYEFGSAK